MIVTSKKGNSNKIHIYANGEYLCTVYDTLWYTSGIHDGDEISDDELAFLTGEAGFRRVYESAISILSHRAHGTEELKRKLIIKHGAEYVSKVTERLAEEGYLNDESFAAALAEELFDRKHWGVPRIEAELRSRGVDREIVKIVTQTLDNNPVMRIILLLEGKFSGSLNDEKGRRRVFAALQRMGYGYSDVSAAFSQIGAGTDICD